MYFGSWIFIISSSSLVFAVLWLCWEWNTKSKTHIHVIGLVSGNISFKSNIWLNTILADNIRLDFKVVFLGVQQRVCRCEWLTPGQRAWLTHRRTGRARSGCALRADRRGPGTARCSAGAGSAAAAPGPVGRPRPSSARARGAQGGNLRDHKAQHGPVSGRAAGPAARFGDGSTDRLTDGPASRRSQTVVPAVEARDLPGRVAAWTCSRHVGLLTASCGYVNRVWRTAAVYSRSLTQSAKPTAARILQSRLRKSIDARDAPRLSLQSRGAKDSWKDAAKVTGVYSFTISFLFPINAPLF